MTRAMDLVKNAARGKSYQDGNAGYGPGKTAPKKSGTDALASKVEANNKAKNLAALDLTSGDGPSGIVRGGRQKAREADRRLTNIGEIRKTRRIRTGAKVGTGLLAASGVAYGASKLFGGDKGIKKTAEHVDYSQMSPADATRAGQNATKKKKLIATAKKVGKGAAATALVGGMAYGASKLSGEGKDKK